MGQPKISPLADLVIRSAQGARPPISPGYPPATIINALLTCLRGPMHTFGITSDAVGLRNGRVECEAHAILTMSKLERDVLFNGRKDENGMPVVRGVIGTRGLKADEEIKAMMERL